MPRTLSATVKSLLASNQMAPRFFIELELASTTIRYWTGSRDVVWNSQTWEGGGYLNGIGKVKLTRRTESEGLQVEIAGQLEVLVSLAMQSTMQNKAASIYFGFLDSTGAVISDPSPYFMGVFDYAEINDNPDQAVITLYFENLLIENNSENELRYNHATQQALYPGDLGFEYIEALEDFRGYWGRQNTNSTTRPGQGGGGAKGAGKGSGGRNKDRKRREKRQRKNKRR